MTAARATAVVSEPPRPRVVMLSSSSMPWKPATMTIVPSSSASRMRARWIDDAAFVWVESVTMPTWAPVKDGRVAEGVDGHSRQGREGDLASPVERSMSISRGPAGAR